MKRSLPLSVFTRGATGLALAAATMLGVAGCSAEPPVAQTVATQLPDLTSQGLEAFDCGSGAVIAENFTQPQEPYKAQCWKGNPDTPFTQMASIIAREVADATGGLDVTTQACPADVLNAQEGIACRAVYVGEQGNDTLVRVIVVIADLEAVLSKVPEFSPTPDDVTNALVGADIEVLVGSEPLSAASASPAA